jgi:AraC family transcriptional regulator
MAQHFPSGDQDTDAASPSQEDDAPVDPNRPVMFGAGPPETTAGVEAVIIRLEGVVSLLRSHSEEGLLGHVQGVLNESIDLLKALPSDDEKAREEEPGLQSGGLAGWQVRTVSRYICDHLDERIAIGTLAHAVNLSASHFGRAFQKSFGLTPMRYVRRTRICRAKRLLEETTLPLIEIAEQCGFADQAQFTRVFQQDTGTTPRRWRLLR